MRAPNFSRPRAGLALVAASAATVALAAQPTPDAGKDMAKVKLDGSMTVSGISSGAFMAQQLHVSFSGSIGGAGMIAGGPFWCAQDDVLVALSACMSNGDLIDVSVLEDIAQNTELFGFIDPLSNLEGSRTWLLSALDDTVVETSVVQAAASFYSKFNRGAGSGDQVTVFNQHGEHSQLTRSYGSPCTFLGSPYINDCEYPAAQHILNHLLEANVSVPTGVGTGSMHPFSQANFIGGELFCEAFGLADTGYVYVPKQCSATTEGGTTCKLHIALHGCEMTTDDIGLQYIEHGGYNALADALDLVVLYPVAQKNTLNPKGCWDWWGYAGTAYASKLGSQTLTIKRFADALMGLPLTKNGTTCSSPEEERKSLERRNATDSCWPMTGGMQRFLPPVVDV